MDLIRATIEAVFFHLPVEAVAEVAVDHTSKKAGELLPCIEEIITRVNRDFTASEFQLFTQFIVSRWLMDEEVNFPPIASPANPRTLSERLLLLPNLLGKDILICNGTGYPTVTFNNLLRWREITLPVGEDLITIPFLARMDHCRGISRQDFCWPNILGHDNFRLNAILEKELSDTHSHINAAQDVFEFNWLAMMNHPEAYEPDASGSFRMHGLQMEYDPAARFSNLRKELRDWVMIAAGIRLYLYRLLYIEREGRHHAKGDESPYITEVMLSKSLSDKKSAAFLTEKIRTNLGLFSERALAADGNLVLDYAIRRDDFKMAPSKVPSTPYMVHHGERSLLYRWFRLYYRNQGKLRKSSLWMLLYLLIKSKVRREFIQTNALQGFKNFQTYQSNKMLDADTLKSKGALSEEEGNAYRKAVLRYAIQTSLGFHKNHFVEARITPGQVAAVRELKGELAKGIFGEGLFLEEAALENVTIVAHFIKSIKEDKTARIRNNLLRNDLWVQAQELGQLFEDQKSSKNLKFVGLDAASSELACRPEVFAPMFRYMRFKGLSNFTFHAGEDFYDILDGLRTIYETVSFMGYTTGCRIGHGLALGLDSRKFYLARHRMVILPRQILLDNMVWLKYFSLENNISLSPETLHLIEKSASSQLVTLGYTSLSNYNGDLWQYWQSMLMRGDFICESPDGKPPYKNEVMFSPVSPARPYSDVMEIDVIKALHNFYERNIDCRRKGNEPESISLPKSFGEDIEKIQGKFLDILEKRGIVIETNPSSNIKIGRFNRYDEHPITLFHNVEGDAPRHSMVVTINTDDKGVFATSLPNEYSLIAIALQKQRDENGNRKWSDLQIEKYLKRIAHYGNISRFRI